MFSYTSDATIVGTGTDKNGRFAIMLDKTIFYPQGGGQPCDLGQIQGEAFIFAVQTVTFADGIVYHAGTVISGEPIIGMNVNLNVDKIRRANHSRMHTGGHVIVNAMKNAGQTLLATKGYHFPDGP